MSMITRCPACETMFRVVPDQLRISAGWVRCGQCDEIFDASAHLLNDTPVVVLSEVSSKSHPQAIEVFENEPVVPPPLVSTVLPEVILLNENSLPAQLPVPYPSDFQELDLNLDDVSTQGVYSIEPETDANQAVLNSPEGVDTIEFGEQAIGVEPMESANGLSETGSAELTAFESPAEPISFLSNNHKTQARGRLAGGWILVVLNLVLLLGLISQGVFRERQKLAAWEPRFSPWLERACDAIGCSVGAVLRIDSISVDSSTFAKLRADTYRLSFSLKNSATIAVAFPAIELTLTDALDRPFLRRVLRAPDLNSADAVIVAGAEWPASIDIAVESAAMPERVAGYRLVAFYP